MELIINLCRFKFPYTTASLSDKKPSFLQTGARQYFPKLGRYLQEDPIRDGLNWFAYCNNNPTNKVDPTGLRGIQICKSSDSGKLTHVWICLTGDVNCWGFHPTESGISGSNGKGMIANDNEYMSGRKGKRKKCSTIELTCEQWVEVRNFIMSNRQTVFKYQVSGNEAEADGSIEGNCQTWVRNLLRRFYVTNIPSIDEIGK